MFKFLSHYLLGTGLVSCMGRVVWKEGAFQMVSTGSYGFPLPDMLSLWFLLCLVV